MGRLLKARARVDLPRRRLPRFKLLTTAQSLPSPVEPEAQAMRLRLLDALEGGDAAAALDLLLRCTALADPGEQTLAAWLPTLVAIDELADHGRSIDPDGRLRGFIANTLRTQLAHAVPCSEPLWVLPATPDEAAAAWLLAVVASQRGRPSRPWLWASLPAGRAFVTVGRRFDAERHGTRDCKGHYGLIGSATEPGIAALISDFRGRERAKAIAERARRWRRDWTMPIP